MKSPSKGARGKHSGPSQRQLRAGELMRHTLVDILREELVKDPALDGAMVTVAEVRMSPDLRHAFVFAQPLGGKNVEPVIDALNRSAKFLRGELGRRIDMKFTPDLVFRKDESFDAAARMDLLFLNPKIQADLDPERGGPPRKAEPEDDADNGA